MADYNRWWANRAGDVAAATVSPVQPVPAAGAALDLSTANLTPSQHEALLNDIQTNRDEEVEAKAWHEKLLGGVGDAIGSAVGWLGDRQSDINDWNDRTHRQLFGEKWYEVNARQKERIGNAVGGALDWFHERVWEPNMRALATPINAINIAHEQHEGIVDFSIFEGETWREAWNRSQNTTLGQGFAENLMLRDAEERRRMYEAGFDEFGNPRNQAFAEIRQGSVGYNLTSGGVDFIKAWYADPLVVAGKGARIGRALHKGDFSRMTRKQQMRVRNMAMVPEEQLAQLKKDTPVWDYVGRRAIALREQTLALRDRVRNEGLTSGQLAEMQAFNQSGHGVTAAHIFAEASKARKVDPLTGRALDEFDSDLFDKVNAALLGHRGAAIDLGKRADDIGDAINALRSEKQAAWDKVLRAQERLDAVDLARAPEGWKQAAKVQPSWNLRQATADYDMVNMGLQRYKGYEDWINRVFKDDVALSMSPRAGTSIGQKLGEFTSVTYRPTGHANTASQVIKYPLAAWRLRPGVANLHSADESFKAGTRLLDEAAAVTKGRHLDELTHSTGGWEATKRQIADELADATTDVQRLDILNRVEDLTARAVGRKYNLDGDQVTHILDDVRRKRSELITTAEGQAHHSYSRATIGGRKIDTFRHVDEHGTEVVHTLPVSVTQLRQSFMATDLKVLDELLHNHSNAIRALTTGKAKGAAITGMEWFNHYWKPSVLFRGGYPVRNVIDDFARAAMSMQDFSFMLAGARNVVNGIGNMPERVHNRIVRAHNRLQADSPAYRRMSERAQQRSGGQALPDDIGPIDVPDVARLSAIDARTRAIGTWERRSAQIEARKAQAKERRKLAKERLGTQRQRLEEAERGPDTTIELTAAQTRRLREFVDQFDEVDLNLANEIRRAAGTKGKKTRVSREAIDEAISFGERTQLTGQQRNVIENIRRRQEAAGPAPARMADDELQALRDEVRGLERQAATKARERATPAAPPVIGRLDNSLKQVTKDHPVAIDAATGKVVKPKEQVGVAFDTSVRRYGDDLTPRDLHRYVEEYSEWLSNPRNVLLVRKVDDGFEVAIGTKGVQIDDAGRLTTRPLRRTGGKDIEVRGERFSGAFGEGGDVYRAANSSEMFNQNLLRSQQLNTERARRDMLQRTVHPDDPEFFGAWADAVNGSIRHDPIMRRILDGWTDDELVRWLRGAQVRGSKGSEGRKLADRVPHLSANRQRWVDISRAHVNHYLPDDRLKTLARERDLDAGELARRTEWDAVPPSVDAVALQHATGRLAMLEKLDRGIDRVYHALATTPTDVLVRNPFFEQNYRYRLNQIMDSTKRGTDDLAEHEIKRLREWSEGQARSYALKQTQQYMFSLVDQSDLTHMLRFVSPFVASWQESIIRWARITMERPESFARAWVQGWGGGLDKLYFLEEDTDPLTGDPVVRVPMPEWSKRGLEKLLPGVSEGDLDGFENTLISKKSLNVTLQGTPWWLPGGGPLVQAPAAYFLHNSPEFQDENAMGEFAWKWLFPAGKPMNWREAILPSWFRQFERYHAEGDDPVYNNLGLLIHRNDIQAWKDRGSPAGEKPTIARSWEKAKGVQAYYTMGRLGGPFAFRLEPASQFWIDKAREYREEYGHQEGLVRFVDEMGEDAYTWWTSLSKANVNVPPTSEGHALYKEHQETIAQFPELAPVIIGLDAFDQEFNAEVYGLQQDISVGPGDARKLRGQKTAQEWEAEVEVRQGWAEYREWRTAIEAELAARGISSIRHGDAHDLLMANRVKIQELKQKLPGWGRDFESYDSGKGYAYVNELRKWVESGRANVERPDVQGVAEYLQLHDAFALELDARQAAGGTRSIESNDNQDLAAAWDLVIGQLTERNPQFADIYYQYLERHVLRNGSN